jgi:hypothetical protein
LRRTPSYALITLALALGAATAHAETEEQHLARIAQKLKPISDSQWNEIAGSKTAETYDVVKGDTLWDISKRLFGNSFYWPKVWSLNNAAGLVNPHVIEPGQKLTFMPGSSESTPKLSASPETTTTTPSAPKAAPRPGPVASGSEMHEYDKIPPDRWAPQKSDELLRKNYDAYGVDKDLKISIPSRFVFRVPVIANDTTIPFLGEVVGSRRDGDGLSQHDTVFLKSNSQDLQVGSSYTVFSEPEFVRERKSDRSGYIYIATGEIKIVGVKDELYVGVITHAYDVISRGDRVYPLLPLINDIKPLPARVALEALTVFSSAAYTKQAAQFHFVHLDRGIEDGVQVGNVFRLYDYYDPVTRDKLTDADFLINADALVVHATAQFSTALVIRSRDTLSRGDFGVLLTDVSDLERIMRSRVHGIGEKEGKTPEDKELDELDELDRTTGEGLGRKEETEIKELDQWDKTKDLQNAPSTEPTVPSAAETPTDEAEKLPGPPAEPGAPGKPKSPEEPTLDQTLDAPTAMPPGAEAPPPPAHLKPAPEQTLEAPPAPPAPEERPIPGEPTPNEGPRAEPMSPPEAAPAVEPAQPTPPDDIESKTN